MTTIKIGLSDGTEQTVEDAKLDGALSKARNAILDAFAEDQGTTVDSLEVEEDGKTLSYACEWDVKLKKND